MTPEETTLLYRRIIKIEASIEELRKSREYLSLQDNEQESNIKALYNDTTKNATRIDGLKEKIMGIQSTLDEMDEVLQKVDKVVFRKQLKKYFWNKLFK